MRRKLWKIRELDPRAKKLAQKYNISIFLTQVLLNRNIEEKDFPSFLNPSVDSFHCPYLLPDIEKAALRVKSAIARKEKVLVVGDYDVDGITALAIFHEFAKEFLGIFSFYIPHRVEEGYGLNRETIIRAREEGVSLIISFDCGTNAYSELELAKSFKIDVIVIDHHYPKDNLAKPFAFVNPKRKDSVYPFSDLSAAAISFKFLQTLTNLSYHNILDLVALSLVCDVVPLQGENRALLKEGLKVIRETKRPAIKALCKVGSIKQENIDTFHIGYILGPRINASGRVAHAQESLALFLTEDETEAYNLAFKLSQYNQLRKNIEMQILKEAEERIEDNISDTSAIVVSADNWHPGVLGIVASRLADRYYRPSFVFSFNQDIGVGSARSIESVHLIKMLDKCADLLLLYGGHSKAAGVHISKLKLENFKERINSLIEENLSPQDFIPTLDIDGFLNFDNINMGLVEDLEKLKPYGEANPKPLFSTFNIFKKSNPKKINSGFSVWLSSGKKTFEGIIYDKDVLEIINYGDYFDIIFSLDKNYYHNLPKLIIRDLRLSGSKN